MMRLFKKKQPNRKKKSLFLQKKLHLPLAFVKTVCYNI